MMLSWCRLSSRQTRACSGELSDSKARMQARGCRWLQWSARETGAGSDYFAHDLIGVEKRNDKVALFW